MRRSGGHCPAVSAVVAIVVYSTAASSTCAQGGSSNTLFQIEIPAERLDRALSEFGAKTGTQVLVDPSLVAGATSRAVSGRYTAEQGLQTLLTGSKLEFSYSATGVILVRRLSTPGSPPAPTVDAPRGPEAPASTLPETIVVTGTRASLMKALSLRRESIPIVDAVYATDIGKLPDSNASEALQRISGVQIQRNEGEGSDIAIRGLSQVHSELDGRTIFTASGERTLKFEDIPSNLLAGLEISKTPTPDQIEGGLGGTVNLRLRQPFDFTRDVASVQVKETYYDNVGIAKPEASFLVSNRWQTAAGEIGILADASLQRSAFRTDFDAGGSPIARTDILDLNGNGHVGDAADTILVPSGAGQALHFGKRERDGFDLQFQWRPDAATEIRASAFAYRYGENDTGILLFAGGQSFSPAAVDDIKLVPGSPVFQSGTWQNMSLDANSYNGGRLSSVTQVAAGISRHQADWSLFAGLSYGLGHTRALFNQLGLTTNLANGAIPEVHQDYSGALPSLSFGGVDLSNPNDLAFSRALQENNRDTGVETSTKVDVERRFHDNFWSAVKFGVRYAARTANENDLYVFNDLSGIPASTHPDLLQVVTLNLFGRANRSGSITDTFLVPVVDAVENFTTVSDAFGLASRSSATAPPSAFGIHEFTTAGYAMSTFTRALDGANLSGNFGIRVIHTRIQTQGQVASPDGVVSAIDDRSDYKDALPQLNVKFELGRRFTFRAAAYRTLTRQDFSSLSPSITFDYLDHSATQGNPALRPLRASNLDFALDYNGTVQSQAFVNLFFKQVTGFPQSVVVTESFFGQSFNVLRPESGPSGRIWGTEMGFIKFLTQLPAPYNGFGFQTNLTLVGSSAPSPISSARIPLQGLSKVSYNLVALYEKGPVSTRLAYNWRSAYVLDSASPAISGYSTDWSAAQGIADASASYAVYPGVKLSLELGNLNNARSATYFSGLPLNGANVRLPHNISQTDRRISLGLRVNY